MAEEISQLHELYAAVKDGAKSIADVERFIRKMERDANVAHQERLDEKRRLEELARKEHAIQRKFAKAEMDDALAVARTEREQRMAEQLELHKEAEEKRQHAILNRKAESQGKANP